MSYEFLDGTRNFSHHRVHEVSQSFIIILLLSSSRPLPFVIQSEAKDLGNT